MLNRSNVWVVPATVALLSVLVAGPTRAAADPAVQAVADLVSQTYYQTYQLDVENMGLGLYGGAAYDMGYRNRDGWEGPGTRGNQEARLYLQDAFAAMNLNVVTVQGGYKNVVGELTGTTTPEKIYIIGGHYDHVAHDRPGGDDNASGTAGVLEAARVLSQYQFESTIRFIGFNAEEDGLLGSWDYVNSLTTTEKNNIHGMLNLDMILRPGSDSNPSHVIDVDIESIDNKDGGDPPYDYPASVTWAQAYQQAAADYVPSIIVDSEIAFYEDNWSDHAPFIRANLPAIMLIENSGTDWEYPGGESNSYYHTRNDASDRLANDPTNPSGVTYDYPFATDVVRVGVALLAQEATLVPKPGADFNGDGDVDGNDFLACQAGFGIQAGSQKSDGDYDNDGDVDGGDLQGWQAEFGSGSGSASSAVPEPTAMVLGLITAAVGMFFRRDRTDMLSR